MQDQKIAKCLTFKLESREVKFKEQFVPTDARQSLEVLKGIVAIANSRGGILTIGINNQGVASVINLIIPEPVELRVIGMIGPGTAK